MMLGAVSCKVKSLTLHKPRAELKFNGQVQALLSMTNTSMSMWWRGYWQGKHRTDETFFAVPPPAARAALSPG